MGQRHYVIQTTDPSVATTKIAVSELLEGCFPTVWLATRESYTDRFRRTRTLEASLFPGYLFVEFDMSSDAWKAIPQARGVRKILGSDPMHPHALADGAVDRYRARFEAGEFKVKPAAPIIAGDRIVVELGPFAGKIGICEMSRGDRIEAMMAEFGGKFVGNLGMVRRAAE